MRTVNNFRPHATVLQHVASDGGRRQAFLRFSGIFERLKISPSNGSLFTRTQTIRFKNGVKNATTLIKPGNKATTIACYQQIVNRKVK